MPPLRDIREEVPLLASHFLKEYCKESRHTPMSFAPDVLRQLAAAPWPGNIRQLRNEVIRMAACAQHERITTEDLLDNLPQNLPPVPAPARSEAAEPTARATTLKEAVEDLERRMISSALEATRNNQQQTARLLGLSRQGLINKLKRYAL
jgi:DNA-binding NtrC family response regulator